MSGEELEIVIYDYFVLVLIEHLLVFLAQVLD